MALSYRETVLATNPVSYWRLGEASGTVAADEMGANNGTYVNAPTLGTAGLLTGDSDTAVAFARVSSQYVDLPAAVTIPNTASLSVWFKRGALQGAAQALISAGWGRYLLGFRVDDRIVYEGLAIGEIFVSTNPLTNTNPHHLVMTYDGATSVAYLDGAVLSGAHTIADAAVGGLDVFIGASNDFDGSGFTALQWFDGTIDEPAIWNRVLSADEVATLYAAGTIPSLDRDAIALHDRCLALGMPQEMAVQYLTARATLPNTPYALLFTKAILLFDEKFWTSNEILSMLRRTYQV